VDGLVVTVSVELNVGVPLGGFNDAIGHDAPQTGPVTLVVNVTLLEVPETSVAVMVEVAVPPWTTLPLVGLAARLYLKAAFTVNVNVAVCDSGVPVTVMV